MALRVRAVGVALATALFVLMSGGTAAVADVNVPAHPLGNFTVSHYNGLTLTPDGVQLLTVIDSAEIPTQQDRSVIDSDGNGELSSKELAARASSMCTEVSFAELLRQGPSNFTETARAGTRSAPSAR